MTKIFIRAPENYEERGYGHDLDSLIHLALILCLLIIAYER